MHQEGSLGIVGIGVRCMDPTQQDIIFKHVINYNYQTEKQCLIDLPCTQTGAQTFTSHSSGYKMFSFYNNVLRLKALQHCKAASCYREFVVHLKAECTVVLSLCLVRLVLSQLAAGQLRSLVDLFSHRNAE